MVDQLLAIFNEANEHMQKAIQHLETELLKIRAGRANPNMLDGIVVDYYGTPTLISQVGNIIASDARTITIQPWEKNMLQPIERAIINSNMGLTPQNDGIIIRLFLPPLTEERRKELVKRVNAEGEHSKIATATFKKIIKDKTITLKNSPAPQYSGGAEDALVDGEIGTEQWQLGGWQGFEGVDLEAIIDLKKQTAFNRIELRCIEDQNAWIFAPTEIQIFTSNDGQKFELLSSQEPILKPNISASGAQQEGVAIRYLGIRKKGNARYIKIVAKPLNPIPAWHKGAGGKGWLFADEIIID